MVRRAVVDFPAPHERVAPAAPALVVLTTRPTPRRAAHRCPHQWCAWRRAASSSNPREFVRCYSPAPGFRTSGWTGCGHGVTTVNSLKIQGIQLAKGVRGSAHLHSLADYQRKLRSRYQSEDRSLAAACCGAAAVAEAQHQHLHHRTVCRVSVFRSRTESGHFRIRSDGCCWCFYPYPAKLACLEHAGTRPQ